MEIAEIKDILAQFAKGLEESRKLNQQGLEESRKMNQQGLEESRKMNQETLKLTQENARAIKQFNKQLGELGNKFGSFAEGMALNSVSKILSEHFDVQMAAWRVKRKNKQTQEWYELDYFGYENSSVNRVVIVEMKSYLRHKDLEKVERIASRFREFFPEHAEKQLFIVIAYIDYEDHDVLTEASEKGFYLASVNDHVFKLQSEADFAGRDFSR